MKCDDDDDDDDDDECVEKRKMKMFDLVVKEMKLD
jgi:hypothetical protein